MDSIKILGGSISGLTAAINLKNAGYDVEVHERKTYCGKQTDDFQFLENWTFDEDVLEFLRKINIQTGFYFKPIHVMEILSPSLEKYVGKSSNPFMYLVKRGQKPGHIDKALENQAKRNGVKIVYKSILKDKDADIISSGFRKPSFIPIGVKFRLKYPDKSIVLLDNNLSMRFYSYFIVNDNIGEIVCVNPIGVRNHEERLTATIRKFEHILGVKIKIDREFSSVVDFHFLQNAKVDGKYFVGEAAGFQDSLAGFGMVYAFKSGYFAARSIIENLNYDELWKKDFLKQLKVSSNNRIVYDKLSNEKYEKIIGILNSDNFILKKLRGGDDLQLIMKKLYNKSLSSFLRRLLLG